MSKKIFFIPVIVAVLIFVYLVKTKGEPKKEFIEDIKRVEIQTFKPKDITLNHQSFGTVYPSKDLKVVSSITADILFINNNLKNGKFLNKGEVLVKFDTTSYLLESKKLDTEIVSLEVQILELQQQISSTKVLLKIENKKLSIYKEDLERYITTKKYISDTKLAQEKIKVLSQEKIVENLKSTLSIIPLNIKSLHEKINTLKLQKKILNIGIEDCIVSMPFGGIVYDIQIENTQYISKNQVLFKVYDPSKMQVDIDISLKFLKELGTIKDLKITTFSKSQNRSFDTIFSRVAEEIDEKTRTIKLIFDIKQNVLKGTFLDVEIFGKTLHDRFEIPKHTYHNGFVYVEKNNKLEFKKVTVEYEQKQSYIISNISETDKIIISNVKPAIKGMKIEARLIGVSDD